MLSRIFFLYTNLRTPGTNPRCSSAGSEVYKQQLLILPVAAVALFPPVGTLAVTVLLIALAAREAARILTKVLGGASGFWITVILISTLFPAFSPALGPVLTITTFPLFLGTVIPRSVRAPEDRLQPDARLLLGTILPGVWLRHREL